MSHPAAPEEDGPGGRLSLAARAVGRWIPALVGLLLFALLQLEARPAHDLVLVAPVTARPGDLIGLRAALFPVDQASKAPAPPLLWIEVALLATDGREGEVLEPVYLRPSHLIGAEGALPIPTDAAGRYLLEARAVAPSGPFARVRRALEVRDDAPRLPRRPLHAGALSFDPIERLEPEAAPERLDLRIAGGACVPEVPCSLLVNTGGSGPRIDVTAGDSVEPPSEARANATIRCEGATCSGISELPVIVRGPEGELHIRAFRDGRLVARRRARVPLMLGGASVSVDHRMTIFMGAVHVRVRSPGGEEAWAVDLFYEGRWAMSTSITGGEGLVAAPFFSGLWEIAVRRAPFSPEVSGVAAVYATSHDTNFDTTVDNLLAHPRVAADEALPSLVAASDALPWPRNPAPGEPPPVDPPSPYDVAYDVADPLIAYAVAPFETYFRPLPLPTHGIEQSAEPEALARNLRVAAWIVLMMGALVSGLLVSARLRAARGVELALSTEGAPPIGSGLAGWRRWLLPLAVGVFVLLVFGVVAYIVASRAGWA